MSDLAWELLLKRVYSLAMRKRILLLPLILFSLLSLQGCYTQLAWLHETNPEETGSDRIERASQRPSLLLYGNQSGSGNFYNRYRLGTYDPNFWGYYSYSPYNTLFSNYYYPGSFYSSGGLGNRGYYYGNVFSLKPAGSENSPRAFTRGKKENTKTNLVINRDKTLPSQKTGGSWSSGSKGHLHHTNSSVFKTKLHRSTASSVNTKSSRSSRSSGSSKRATRRN